MKDNEKVETLEKLLSIISNIKIPLLKMIFSNIKTWEFISFLTFFILSFLFAYCVYSKNNDPLINITLYVFSVSSFFAGFKFFYSLIKKHYIRIEKFSENIINRYDKYYLGIRYSLFKKELKRNNIYLTNIDNLISLIDTELELEPYNKFGNTLLFIADKVDYLYFSFIFPLTLSSYSIFNKETATTILTFSLLGYFIWKYFSFLIISMFLFKIEKEKLKILKFFLVLMKGNEESK